MKKFITLALVAAMASSMGISTFATETGLRNETADVTGTYVEGTTGSATVFDVEVAWEGMNFTYNAEKQPVWNSETHTYSEAVPAHWSEGTGTITVTNHSNARISAAPSFEAVTGQEKVEMTFSTDSLKVASAVLAESAQEGTITVTPAGEMNEAEGEGVKLGTITVTIEERQSVTQEEGLLLAEQFLNRLNAWKSAGLISDFEATDWSMSVTEMSNNFNNSEEYGATEYGINAYNRYLNQYLAFEAQMPA